MLQVDGLGTGYGMAQALYDVSLRVEDGEIVTILGPNGAGKTSLVNAIAGVLRPWGGSVTFDGIEMTTLPPHRVIEHGMALVPEGRRIFPKMTVTENLDLGSYTATAMPGHDAALESVYMSYPRLKDRHSQVAGTLSGGEQQMLAIGRALMAQPRLLLLDEPSLGLAPSVVLEMFNVVREINRGGVAGLIVV